MQRNHIVRFAVCLCTLLAATPAVAESTSPALFGSPQLTEHLQRSAALLSQERERRSVAGVAPRYLGQPRQGVRAFSATSTTSAIPLALQLGKATQLRFAYAMTSADQQSRDPLGATLQGFGFTGNLGFMQSDSQVFFLKPKFDHGAAATLVNDFKYGNAFQGVDPKRLREGRALRQTLNMNLGAVKLSGRFQEIDETFTVPQRLMGGDLSGDTAQALQELAAQAGTERTTLGMTTTLGKQWALSGNLDTLDDGAGQIRRQEFGLTGSFLKLTATRQDIDSEFTGFHRFADDAVAGMAGQRGVRKRGLAWELTPTKWMSLQGAQDHTRDGAGDVETRTLSGKLGRLQFSDTRRSIEGFQSWGAVAAPDQAMAKIAGVNLRQTNASLGLGGNTSLAFAETEVKDAAGEATDAIYSLSSKSIQARAQFRTVDGLQSFGGLGEYNEAFKPLASAAGQRQELYDLNYTGSKWFGLTNHYGRVRGLAGGEQGWERTEWTNAVNLNLGRTSALFSRSQYDTETGTGDKTHERSEFYQVRRAVQKDGFLLAEHLQQTSVDAQQQHSVRQQSRVQGKVQVGSLFAAEGQRVERFGTGTDHENESAITLSRSLGSVNAAWSFASSHNAGGDTETRKLALGGTLWKGLTLQGHRQTTMQQAHRQADGEQAPSVHASDTRLALTQSLGKSTKASFSYVQVSAGDTLQARQYGAQLETAVAGMQVTGHFTQHQTPNAPMAVVQGFTLTDQKKDDHLDWSVQYKHRSRAISPQVETKGWTLRYKGEGEAPLTITGSYMINGEGADGNVVAGRQAAISANGQLLKSVNVGVGYQSTSNEAARQANERYEVTLSGALGKDHKWSLSGATQRTFEPEGDGLRRTRLETVRVELAKGAGETFRVGGEINWRGVQGAAAAYSCEYRADVRVVGSF